jgi:hypothetical protein
MRGMVCDLSDSRLVVVPRGLSSCETLAGTYRVSPGVLSLRLAFSAIREPMTYYPVTPRSRLESLAHFLSPDE